MSAQRWQIWDMQEGPGVMVEVLDDGCEGERRQSDDKIVVLAADYERDVAAAEVRGWNAALEGAISACQADWRFEDHNDWYLAAVAALRKPTEAQT